MLAYFGEKFFIALCYILAVFFFGRCFFLLVIEGNEYDDITEIVFYEEKVRQGQRQKISGVERERYLKILAEKCSLEVGGDVSLKRLKKAKEILESLSQIAIAFIDYQRPHKLFITLTYRQPFIVLSRQKAFAEDGVVIALQKRGV